MISLLIIFLPLIMCLGMWYAHSLGHKQGYALGYKNYKAALTPDVKIECLCGHGPNFHIDGTGSCDQTVNWTARFKQSGTEMFDKRDKCRCKKYTGPDYTPLTVDLLQLGK
jgi:hypothetical protein